MAKDIISFFCVDCGVVREFQGVFFIGVVSFFYVDCVVREFQGVLFIGVVFFSVSTRGWASNLVCLLEVKEGRNEMKSQQYTNKKMSSQ